MQNAAIDKERCPLCGSGLPQPAIHAPDRLHGTPYHHAVTVCATCGAGTTLPRVTDDELGGFYPETYNPYNDAMPPLARLASRAIRAFQRWNMLRSAPLSALTRVRPGRALDVGCGRGDLGAALIGRGWRAAGIEPSPDACSVAASRGIDVSCGTLATVPPEHGAYRAVIFRHSLEHTTDPVAALRTAAAALEPDGLALISVPNFGSWEARRFRGYWFHLELPRHRVHFTPDALRRALGAAGLETLELSTSSSSVGLPASIQYRVFGRCVFPDGLANRIASGLCALTMPISVALAHLSGGGDTLHAVAIRRAGA